MNWGEGINAATKHGHAEAEGTGRREGLLATLLQEARRVSATCHWAATFIQLNFNNNESVKLQYNTHRRLRLHCTRRAVRQNAVGCVFSLNEHTLGDEFWSTTPAAKTAKVVECPASDGVSHLASALPPRWWRNTQIGFYGKAMYGRLLSARTATPRN